MEYQKGAEIEIENLLAKNAAIKENIGQIGRPGILNLEDSESIEDSFLLSALTEKSQFYTLDEFMSWFNSRKQANNFLVEQIPFDKLDGWHFEDTSGNLVHKSGKFFKIKGVRINMDFGDFKNWDQPIIDQPEIGILGIITKKFGGIRYFLMQAKMEPGNVNIIQLSPTVQATKSNYTQVHGGSRTPYLEYFIDRTKAKILIDQLQTEQGARFLRKRNRNMIVEVNEEIEAKKDFCWLTLGQIKKLLTIDNLVNMDSRSVLSCIDYIDNEIEDQYKSIGVERFLQTPLMKKIPEGFKKELFISMIDKKRADKSLAEIINWLTEIKARYEANMKEIPLKEVNQWKKFDDEIKHESKRFFSVIAVDVKADNREVKSWTQPLIKQSSYGIVGFLSKKINNVLHFLVQARVDACNFNIVELVPTVACTEAKYKFENSNVPFLNLFMNPNPNQIKYWSTQSEEGGRFYQSQNNYVVLETDESKPLEIPKNYIWMTASQIMELIKHNYFNIDARGIMACLSLI